MITKKLKILEIMDNSVVYELEIVTTQKLTMADSISQISEKYMDSLVNLNVQTASVAAADAELASIDADESIAVDVKNKSRDKTRGLRNSLSSSIENLSQDVSVYKEILDAYNTKKKA